MCLDRFGVHRRLRLGRVGCGLAVFAGVATGCTAPAATVPMARSFVLQVVAGAEQSGTPRSSLGRDVVVRVRGEDGQPVTGLTLSAIPSDSTAHVAPRIGKTDKDGQLAFVWTLGEALGQQVLRVGIAAEHGGASVTAHADCQPAAPARVDVLSGADLVVAPGDGAPTVIIQVIDRQGRPASGVEVAVGEPTHALDDIQPRVQRTDSLGRATVRWFFSPIPGEHVALGMVRGLQSVRLRLRVKPSIVELAMHQAGGCALTSTGSIVCWGQRLGRGSLVEEVAFSAFPIPVAGADQWVQLRGTCAATTASLAKCWGFDNLTSVFGNPQNWWTPREVARDVAFVATNVAGTTCVIDRGGSATCWGSNAYAEAGAPAISPPFQLGTFVLARPTIVQTPRALRTLSLGDGSTTAIATDGTLFYWGLGSPTVRAIGTSLRFSLIAGSFPTLCGIAADQKGYCWNTAANAFQSIPGLNARLRSLSRGYDHWCAVDEFGRGYCWGGANGDGVLGIGSTMPAVLPTPLATTERFLVIDAAWSNTCAISQAQELWCWGTRWLGDAGRVGADSVPQRMPWW